MCADAAELVVQAVQVLAQQPHHLQAEVAVIAQEIEKNITRDESDGRVLPGLGRNAVIVSAHTLDQAKDGTRPGDLKQLLSPIAGRQQNPHFAGFDDVDTARARTLAVQLAALGIDTDGLDPMQGLPEFRAQSRRCGLGKHVLPHLLCLS